MSEMKEIIIPTLSGDYGVKAIICSDIFAIHHEIVVREGSGPEESDTWSVTHLPSGRAVVQGLRHFNDARDLVDELSVLKVRWADAQEITKDNYQAFMSKATLKKIRGIIKRYVKQID